MSNTDTILNVLLVEDSDDDRYFFEHALKRAGAAKTRLCIANDGLEAIQFFENKGRFADPRAFPQPDVVFLDLKMPGRNGFEVLRWLNEHSRLKSTKVIVLSGSAEPQDMEMARKLGAQDYLVKPVTVDRLQELLKL